MDDWDTPIMSGEWTRCRETSTPPKLLSKELQNRTPTTGKFKEHEGEVDVTQTSYE